jgi:hypothetical protein
MRTTKSGGSRLIFQYWRNFHILSESNEQDERSFCMAMMKELYHPVPIDVRYFLLPSLLATVVCLLLTAGSLRAAGEGALKPVVCDPSDGLAYPEEGIVFINRPVGANAPAVDPKAMYGTHLFGKINVSIAIDTSRPDAARPDTVRIAFDNSGKFGPKSAIPLTNVRPLQGKGHFLAGFGPGVIPIVWKGKTYHIGVRGKYYHNDGGRRVAKFVLNTAVQGSCRFGKKTRKVRFIDTTGNFRFDDAPKAKPKSFNSGTGDIVLIDTGDGKFGGSVVRTCYGQSVCVDGTWWNVAISADGTRATVKPAKVAVGKLSVAARSWELALVRDRKLFLVTGRKDVVGVPAGRYEVFYYRQWSAAGRDGQRAMFMAGLIDYAKGVPKIVTVTEGETTAFGSGAPLDTTLGAVSEGGFVRLSMTKPVTANGMSVFRITSPGGWIYSIPECPKVQIRDAAGEQVAMVSLPYK